MRMAPRSTSAVPVIEVALSREALAQASVKVGAELVTQLADERANRFAGPRPLGSGYVVYRLVGAFDVIDETADYWFGDVALQRATITGSVDSQQVHAAALAAAAGYGRMADAQSSIYTYRWRFAVLPDRIDGANLDRLRADVRRIKAEYPAYLGVVSGGTGQRPVGGATFDATALRTGLDALFERFLAQRRLTEAILAVVVSGLLAIALVVMGLVGALLAERRRSALTLQRGRGASASQIILAAIVEGALLTVPAAALGLVLATLVPARPTVWSAMAAAGVAASATLLLAAVAWPVARRPLGQLERADAPGRGLSVRRLVGEGVVIVLAVLGIYLLRRRGLSAAATDSGFDPFLAAVPVLAGVAVGLVVLRLYPYPVRLVAWLASLGRGFVAVFSLRRVGRQPGTVHLPLLVLLLSVGIAVFSSILLVTIERGQDATAWQQVGAAYRIEAPAFGELPASFDPGAVPGVQAHARAYRLGGVIFDMQGTTAGPMTLDAVQTDALETVTAGTPADPHLPASLLAPPPAGTLMGTDQNPIPALTSVRTPIGQHQISVGERFQMLIEGAWTRFEVAAVRDHLPGIESGTPFVLASFDQLQASRPTRPVRVTAQFVRGPASAEAALRAAANVAVPGARIASQAGALAQLAGSPLIGGVADGFRIGLLLAAIYSALAVIVAVTLTAVARARDLAFLRTLGLSGPQSLGMTVVEHVPGVLLALVAGVGLGVAVANLIAPSLDLQAFAGHDIPVALRIDWPLVALLSGAMALVVALAVGASVVLARRASMGRGLRLGDE